MKRRKNVLLLPLLLALTLFCGCGGASKEASSMPNDIVMETTAAAMEEGYYSEYEDVMMDEMGIVSDSATGASTPAHMKDQKLIKRVSMRAETEDLDSLLEAVNAQINQLGGYIEYQQNHNGSMYDNYRHRSAELTIRIPADQLENFVEQVEGQSNVVSYNQTQDNVTLTYVATESRVKALETEQARLLELMEKAETMTDLLEIEARLTDVRYELENVTSQLRVLSNQVDYATIDLSIEQVQEYTPVEEQTFWQQITNGFRDNLLSVAESLTDLLIWFITHLPQLILLAIVLFFGLRIYRRRRAQYEAKGPAAKAPVSTPDRKNRFAKKSESSEKAAPIEPAAPQQPRDPE